MSGFGAEDGVTEVLDARRAASVVDPAASTQVLAQEPVIGPPQSQSGPATVTLPAPLVSRRVAAETGVYLGSALVLIAISGVVVGGWSDWDSSVRWTFTGLTAVALVAAALFVRLPWSRPLGGERRRAVSALLTCGAVVAATAPGVVKAADAPTAALSPGSSLHASGAAAALLLVNVVARTPVSEAGLLAALAWGAWVVVPPGPGTWAFLVALGAVWAGLGNRFAQGPRTAAVAGSCLALAASIGMAAGPWAWPTRAALAAVTVFGLASFLRGGANHRLALGAGSATALAASVAGAVVGPALALLVGGLATIAVSWIALRGARRG